jgi:hypothetical protein
MKQIYQLCITAILILYYNVITTAAVIYVDIDAIGINDGSSWADAYTDLQDALDASSGITDEVWVATGTYLPLQEPDGAPTGAGNERYRAFHLANKDMEVYGGFTGVETLLSERSWLANPTILSGDFNGDDVVMGSGTTLNLNITNNGENAYHVFISIGLTTATEFNGFSVVGGNANSNLNFNYAGATIVNSSGGGMHNRTSSPTLKNMTFSNNRSSKGGGMSNNNSSPIVTKVTFSNNIAVSGGGINNDNGSAPIIINATFLGNLATWGGGVQNLNGSAPIIAAVTFLGNYGTFEGGGINNDNSSPTLFDVTFSANQADLRGGGIFNDNSSPTLTKVTFSANHANINGGGIYNEISSPVLSNVTFSENTALRGAGIYNFNGSLPSLINVSFSANNASINGGAMFNFNASATLTNTLFYGNISPDQKDIFNDTSTPVLSFSAFEDYDITGCASCITLTASPFVNVADPDGADNILMTVDDGLTITNISPCTETGTVTGAPLIDIVGTTRPSPPSMGSYEVAPIDCSSFTLNIAYVDINATGTNNGSSWADAFTDLQDALDVITDCPNLDAIWIAEGIYFPTSTTDRTISFEIPGNITVYGGFSPSNGAIDLGTRDFTAYLSILSGDIGVPVTATDNTAHVIRLFDGSGPIVLDGIMVSNGYADIISPDRGGGIDIQSNAVQLTLRNCMVSNNYAGHGGGISIIGVNCFLTIENSEILNNTVYVISNNGTGGGISTLTTNNTIEITNSKIANNNAGIGGGLYIRFGTLNIENTIIDNNSSQLGGGGICVVSNIVTSITNSVISNNTTISNGGGGLLNRDSELSLENVLFYNNSADKGGGLNYMTTIVLANPAKIVGCTFSLNTVSGMGGHTGNAIHFQNLASTGGLSSIQNTIVWDNGTSPLTESITWSHFVNAGTTANWNFNLLQSNYQGSGLDGTDPANDPLFTNPATGDFTLQATSPVIDQGDNTQAILTTDLAGNARIQDGDGNTIVTIDYGAYEFLCLFSNTMPIYVDITATGNNDGTSWADAFTDFQDALDAYCNDAEIWVAKGDYLPTEEPDGFPTGIGNERYRAFHLANKDIKIYGGFIGTETLLNQRDWQANSTILNGDFNGDDVITGGGATLSITNNGENAYHVFLGVGLSAATELDGFSIIEGNTNLDAASSTFAGINIRFDRGGGIYLDASSPTLTNLTFSGNSAVQNGGAMHNSNNSSPIFTNVTFSANHSDNFGGAVSNRFSSPIFTNVVFSKNNANIQGGALYNSDASSTLTNVTFSANNADLGGAIRNFNNSSVNLTNALFYGNTALTDKDIGNFISTVTAAYCAFEDYAFGAAIGCITLMVNPFVNAADSDGADNIPHTADDGLALQICSPATNAGTIPSPAVPMDILGNSRLGAYDMGAYESQTIIPVDFVR